MFDRSLYGLVQHVVSHMSSGRLSCGGRALQRASERGAMLLHQMRREARERHVLEEQRLRQGPQHALKPARDIDDDDGVEAVFHQCGVGADARRVDLRRLGQQLLQVFGGPIQKASVRGGLLIG